MTPEFLATEFAPDFYLRLFLVVYMSLVALLPVLFAAALIARGVGTLCEMLADAVYDRVPDRKPEFARGAYNSAMFLSAILIFAMTAVHAIVFLNA